MLKDILPLKIYTALTLKSSMMEINEVRLRVGKPISVLCNTKQYFLGEQGLCNNPNQAIFATRDMLTDIVFKASDFSIYSINEQLKQGFITVKGGVRIGVCGTVVKDEKIKTINEFSSLCIRLPHLIKNASLPIFNHVVNNGKLNNVLIIAPPGGGKTTMLRDIVYQLSYHGYPFNIFIADERGEITAGVDGFNLGNFYDSLCFLSKSESILLGLRGMSPDIIVTDELGAREDFYALKCAINSGVKVIATVHASSIDELKNKSEFAELLEEKCFDRFVVLSKENGVGTIEGVYKDNLTKIYGGSL
ncbi:MAG: stage III sporulation protein AA [Clostridia bacterium]|nr:stage III sporulation protein AA [Clostridia bacterium]